MHVRPSCIHISPCRAGRPGFYRAAGAAGTRQAIALRERMNGGREEYIFPNMFFLSCFCVRGNRATRQIRVGDAYHVCRASRTGGPADTWDG